jgi:hypothetical protein
MPCGSFPCFKSIGLKSFNKIPFCHFSMQMMGPVHFLRNLETYNVKYVPFSFDCFLP